MLFANTAHNHAVHARVLFWTPVSLSITCVFLGDASDGARNDSYSRLVDTSVIWAPASTTRQHGHSVYIYPWYDFTKKDARQTYLSVYSGDVMFRMQSVIASLCSQVPEKYS